MNEIPSVAGRHYFEVGSGSSSDSVEQFVDAVVPGARLSLNRPAEEVRWRAEFAAASGLSLWRVEIDAAELALQLPGNETRFTLSLPYSGALEARYRSGEVVAGPGSALVNAASGMTRFVCRGSANYGCLTLKFDLSRVNRLVSRLFEGATLRTLQLEPWVDLSSPAGKTIQHLATTIAVGVRGGLIRSTAAALLEEAVLQLLVDNVPNRFSGRFDPERAVPLPRHVEDAIGFMRAKLHEPLTLEQVADAVGVSERSLQAGFRKFRDTTPLAYLRDIRLEAVHAELSSPENSLSVNEVAEKWGFSHMGRFAARYRAAFGVLPSETAMRARVRD